jgi:hypothetical protein
MERGGRCTDWLEEVTHNGPGMQARANGQKTVFANRQGYDRQDEDADSWFYSVPRLVGHVDTQASSMRCSIYSRFMHRKDRVLDLMSSVQSQLAENFAF